MTAKAVECVADPDSESAAVCITWSELVGKSRDKTRSRSKVKVKVTQGKKSEIEKKKQRELLPLFLHGSFPSCLGIEEINRVIAQFY